MTILKTQCLECSVSKSELINLCEKKHVIIWGARMTGLGALRFLKHHNKTAVGFVDSDRAFKNTTVSAIPVFDPKALKEEININKWDPLIVIAASLKETEILGSLKINGLSGYDYFSFQSEDAPYFTVDILGSCNLACGSCPHSILEHGVPKGSMDIKTVEKVIDKIKKDSPETTHISLYSWGEPLLHPKVSKIVDYVHKNGMAVALSSNLSLNFEERIESLVRSEPEYLKVSVSGYYPETYNTTHQGGDVNLVKSNLYRIRYYMDKHKANMLVDINYHLYRDNNGKNLKMFKKLASELGFMLSTTYALVMPLERVLNHLDGKTDLQTSMLQKNLLVNIDEGIETSSKNVKQSPRCPFRENQINVNADLTVPVCCTVFHRGENVVAENFLNSSLKEIAKNKAKVKVCQKCMENRLPEYNMGFNKKDWKTIAESKSPTEKSKL